MKNNMLNSTKTWQERFDKKFVASNIGSIYNWKAEAITRCSDVRQFISDLRKQDEEELIKRLDYLDNNREEHQIIGEFKQLIKDYYEN